ncbi:MAG: DUF6599 family protein [bacterium]
MLKTINLRRACQVVSFLFFIALIVLTAYPLAAEKWVDFFPRLSPHLLLGVLLDAWREPARYLLIFLPGLVVLGLTPLLGRFFCGWVCPMGFTLDVTDRLLRRHRDNSRELLKWKPVKYYVLFFVLVTAYFEVNFYGWLDPLSLVTRTYELAMFPVFDALARISIGGLRPLGALRPVVEPLDTALRAAVLPARTPQTAGMVWLVLIFAGILMLAYLNRRFWCRFVCPLGAIHAVFSLRPVVRRVVSDGCTECGRCERACRMGAIGEGGWKGHPGECIECFTCVDVCPEGAVSFKAGRGRVEVEPVNLSRRGFVGGAVCAAVAVPVVRIGAEPYRGESHLIRPPGVWGEQSLFQECVRCGECMKVCPTNAIQPAWFEAGLEGLWAPRLALRIGYCEYSCALCGRACPTEAIRKLSDDEKPRAVIGVAKFDKNRCISWAENRDCLVCEEHCPVPEKAIRFREETAADDSGAAVVVKRPYVVEELCIGCGICENKCPVAGQAAVRVHTVEPFMREKGEGMVIRGLFPEDEVGPWSPRPPAMVYEKDRLFDFINGGAEIYYEYGFARAATMEYARGEDSLTVDVFEMSDPAAAFGIFSYERSPGQRIVDVGDGGVGGEVQVAFRRGGYYIKVNYYGGGDGSAVLERFARAVSGRIKTAGSTFTPPAAVEETAVAGTVLLVRGPLALRNVVYMPKGIDLPFAAGAAVFAYESAEGKAIAVDFPGEAGETAKMKAGFAAAGFEVAGEYETGIVFKKK